MKNIEDIVVIVQARLSSERCPRKMIKPFAGSNLVEICLKKLKQSEVFDQSNIYLSAYDKELIDVAKKNNINVFHRSECSANWDGRSGEKLAGIYEWWDKLPYKYVVLVNACTPLLKIKTIDGFILDYSRSDSDGAFSVIEKKDYFWDENFNFLTPIRGVGMNTKNVVKTYQAAHCLYGGKMSSIGNDVWMGDFNKPGEVNLYTIPENETLDIDYEWQFKSVESVYRHVCL